MKKITLIFSILALLLTQTGCGKDFLETSSSTDASEMVILSNFDGLLSALNGVHRMCAGLSTTNQRFPSDVGTSQSYGGLYSYGFIMDHMGEDLILRISGSSHYHSAANWTEHRNEGTTNLARHYSFFFAIVGQMNMILAYVDAVPATDDQRNMIKGQALTYRAMAYWRMVQLWGTRYVPGANNTQLAVPLVTKPISSPQARASVEDIYKQINEDLDQAIICLTDNEVSAEQSRAHIKACVAHGMKARVALTQGLWSTAANHAKLARNTLETGMRLGTAAELLNGMWQHNHPEFMWAMEQPGDQGSAQASFSGYMSINYTGTMIREAIRGISTPLYESMDATDVRREWWVSDPENSKYDAIRAANSTKIHKYCVQRWRMQGLWTNPSTTLSVAPCFMRVSEMYLIEAEAEQRGGSDANARTALTTMMNVRQPGYSAAGFSGPALLEEIRRHRRIELWGEGFRFYDLKRDALPLVRTTDLGGPAQTIFGAIIYPGIPTQWGATLNAVVEANDLRWLWQIPRREILASQGMITQNP